MGDISEFKRRQTVGAHLAGSSVPRTESLCAVTWVRAMSVPLTVGWTTFDKSGCRQCEACIVLWTVFPTSVRVTVWRSTKRVNTRTVAAQWSTGVNQWWFGLQYHDIPYGAWWTLPNHSWVPWTQWFKHCTLMEVSCISMIMHQYTQQDLWQTGLMNMEVKLNISHDLFSLQI